MRRNNEFKFTGPFAPMCAEHVRQKMAVGLKFKPQAIILRRFDEFSRAYPIESFCITKELAEAWSERRPNESMNTRYNRVGVMQRFSDFLIRQGYESYKLPRMPQTTQIHTPYIFTKDELRRIFARLDAMKQTAVSPWMHLSMPLVFRMLYGCGLRVSEALSLRFRDVNLEQGTIHIRHGKNDDERKVPMAQSLLALCKEYAKKVRNKNDDFFFHTKTNTRYSCSTITKRLRVALWDVGISYRGPAFGPRVHDFRHTFVCHRLNAWADEDRDITGLLPVLSKYLGHTSVKGTEWYLKLTAEAYPQITEKIQGYSRNVFPDLPAGREGNADE